MHDVTLQFSADGGRLLLRLAVGTPISAVRVQLFDRDELVRAWITDVTPTQPLVDRVSVPPGCTLGDLRLVAVAAGTEIAAAGLHTQVEVAA
jgi:hypothetical protein